LYLHFVFVRFKIWTRLRVFNADKVARVVGGVHDGGQRFDERFERRAVGVLGGDAAAEIGFDLGEVFLNE